MARAPLVLALGVVTAALSCLGPEDIDRTQPEKVRKALFEGEWYFRQTVIDMPATSEVTFIGEQGVTERVVWDVERDLLLAYRSYPFLEGADHVVRPGTREPLGTPVAAFRIESHFDVQREYNPRTGEQTNVIVENDTDRPWYEREWMRVDWSQNLVSDFQFTVAGVRQQPVAYYVPEGQTPEEATRDAAILTDDYIDVVHFILAEPEIDEEWSWWFGYPFLKCWFYDAVHTDCLGAPIKVRSAFMKVRPSDYLPLEYDDLRMTRFGYFRNERYTYDDEYGVTEGGRRLLANRYNLWRDAASCYDPEAERPFSSCTPEKLRTIPFHLTEEFPVHLRPMAKANVAEWDRVMKEAVLRGTGWDPSVLDDKSIVLLCPHNPVVKDDPIACGPVGTRPQVGDLRYNLYAYIPNELAGAPLGYGPSATDPLTGETITGNAFYYGAAGRFIAARTRDIIELELGLLDADELAFGTNAKASVQAARAQRANAGRRLDPAAIREEMSRRGVKGHATRLRALKEQGVLALDKRDLHRARLATAELDDAFVTDEIEGALAAFARDDVSSPAAATGGLDPVMLLDDRVFTEMRERRRRFLSPRGERAGGCVLRAEDVFDDGLLGLVDEIERRFYDTSTSPPTLKPGFTDEDVLAHVEALTMGDTQLHELGHVFGLRHNFAATSDALNYEPEFWTLKGPGFLMKEGEDERPRPEWALDGLTTDGLAAAVEAGLRTTQLSSVMDYTSTYGTNIRLRAYDRAAIAYAYLDVVEVFESDALDAERAKLLRNGEVHYTFLPEVVSDAPSYAERVAALWQRRSVNHRFTRAGDALRDPALHEVPYRFCSDEYVDTQATCQIWDQGADSYERAVKTAQDYRSYTLLDAYKRDRVGWGGDDAWSYLVRIYLYRFTLLLNQYKNWVNDELIVRYGAPCITYQGGERVEGYEHGFDEACGLDGYVASIEALNLFAEILETPDTGCYTRLDTGCYLVDPVNEKGVDEAQVFLVDADPAACDGLVPNIAPGATPVRPLKVDAQFPYVKIYGSDPSCAGVEPIRDQTGGVVSVDTLSIDTPIGRPSETRYDRETYGYYFFYKPVVMGSWWDKWMAVKALGDPWTDFIGTDTSADVQSYLINYNSLFVADVNNLVGGIAADNPRVYGPRLKDGEVEILPAVSLAGTVSRATSTEPWIDPMPEYTFRLWAFFNAAYQGQWADDLEFSESLMVTPAFAVTDVLVDDAVRADPTRYAELLDPVTGLTWFALRQTRTNDTGEPIYSVGYEFLREMKDRYYVGGRSGPGTTWLPGLYDWLPRGDVRMLTFFHQTARLYGAADVWEGDFDLYE